RIVPCQRREAGLFQILLDGSEHPALDAHQANPGGGRLGGGFAFHVVRSKDVGDQCSALNATASILTTPCKCIYSYCTRITSNFVGRKPVMKLFYSPGACSLSPHIALHEAGLAHELVKVDLKAKKTEKGDDFNTINPKGQVPALMLDSGELLTEGPVIVQVIADKASAKNLAPPNGTEQRYKMQEWLNFTTSELHKNFSPLFNPAIPDDVKKFFVDRIMGKFKYID